MPFRHLVLATSFALLGQLIFGASAQGQAAPASQVEVETPGHAPIPVLSPARIAEVAQMLPAKPAGFGPPCADRAAWKPLLSALDGNVGRAAQFVSKPLPPWDDAKYLQNSKTGSRAEGEAMLREHDGQLSTLVLAECDEWRGRFLPRIAEQLDAIAVQRSWTLPVHDLKLQNFNGERYFVDLNASSLALAVTQALYMLGDKIPEPTRKHISAGLETHIFGPMRVAIAGGQREFWFYGNSNWNAVCWNGTAGSALAVLPDRNERALFAAAAALYSDGYLGSYSESGYAMEGIGYWGYGFSNYEELREHLWAATQGKIDLYDNPKAQKAALFPFQFQMLPGVYADIADARFNVKLDEGMLRRVDRIFGLGIMQPDTRAKSIGGGLQSAALNAFPVPSERRAARQAARHAAGKTGYDALVGLRTYYAGAGVLVSRPNPGGKLAVTIKAGGNGGHSHNDIGSYSIGLVNTQPVGDPGGPLFYTSDTFTAKRFESKLLNSFGHPVPAIDGHLQLNATDVAAPVLSTNFTPAEDTISIDLSHAYDDPKLRKLTRTMHYFRASGGSVELEDSFEIAAPIDLEESFPTHGSWKQLDAKTLRFDLDDAHLEIVIEGAAAFTASAEAVNDYGQPFTRVGVRIHLGQSGTVRMIFTPVQ